MIIISNQTLLTLAASNYRGLQNKELLNSIRKFSTIELSRPVSLEDIEIEVSEFRSNFLTPTLTVTFFGKDVEANDQVSYSCVSESFTLEMFPISLQPSNGLIYEWRRLNNGLDSHETLIVERVGFSTAFDDIMISVKAKVNELV